MGSLAEIKYVALPSITRATLWSVLQEKATESSEQKLFQEQPEIVQAVMDGWPQETTTDTLAGMGLLYEALKRQMDANELDRLFAVSI
jgi:CRISPR/Cas system-associated exonuclease Cas4 (RecB family)